MLTLSTTPESSAESQARLDAISAALAAMGTDIFSTMFGASGILAEAVVVAAQAGARSVTLEMFPAGPEADMLASSAGFVLTRELLQLRRSLPLGPPWEPYDPVEVRAFRPGTGDEQAWLEVNNRAFAEHPEQGGWTLETLHSKMVQPWFDPDGFLLHEREGRLAGFCWTKVHNLENPPAGEIYVIGVDPDFQGRRLGQPLTRAGFEWLAGKGLTRGLLYCESDNASALGIYSRLGFVVATTHRWYTHHLPGRS